MYEGPNSVSDGRLREFTIRKRDSDDAESVCRPGKVYDARLDFEGL